MSRGPFATILYEATDGLATLTLNRPERRNATTNQMVRETAEALTIAAADASLRLLVLTGAGSSFCPAPISTGSPPAAVGSARPRCPARPRRPAVVDRRLPSDLPASLDGCRHNRRGERRMRRRGVWLGLRMRLAGGDEIGQVQLGLPRCRGRRRHGPAVESAPSGRRRQGPRTRPDPGQVRRRRGAADRARRPCSTTIRS